MTENPYPDYTDVHGKWNDGWRENAPKRKLCDRTLTKAERDAQEEMRIVCRVWVECPPERRPTPAALGQRIADIAAALSR